MEKRYLDSDDHQGKEDSQVGSQAASRISGVRIRFQLQQGSRQVYPIVNFSTK